MARAHLPRREADEIRELVAGNKLDRALNSLQLASSHHEDNDLRNFALIRRSELVELRDDHANGTIAAEALRVRSNQLRAVILNQTIARRGCMS
jgi:hypothetical protein